MYKLCKTEQSTKRQREIENCLLSLMTEKLYDSITITELCERFGMPRKAFYRYFDSKDGALYALIEHTCLSYTGLGPEGGKKKRTLREEMKEFFSFWRDQKSFLDAFQKSDLLPKLVKVSLNFPIHEFLVISKFLPDHTAWERSQIFKYTMGGLFVLMLDWYRSGFSPDAGVMADIAAKILETQLFSGLNDIGAY